MIRALFYILLVAGLAVLFAWFAENPGQITIDWPGYEIDISLFRFTVAILILAGLIYIVVTLLSRVLGGPRRLRRFLNRRREIRGYTALRRGIFAVGAGDETTATQYAVEARRALRDEPLTMLLDAQAAQLNGDHRAAQRLFEAMSENPETRLLGLRGLFLEASREKQMVAAEQYAARAMQLKPSLQWPVNALFDMQCRNRNWQGALETLSIARTHRHVSRQLFDRRKAVLLTAQAYDLEDGESGRSLDLAIEAHRLEPSLVPAAVIAGRTYSSQGITAIGFFSHLTWVALHQLVVSFFKSYWLNKINNHITGFARTAMNCLINLTPKPPTTTNASANHQTINIVVFPTRPEHSLGPHKSITIIIHFNWQP